MKTCKNTKAGVNAIAVTVLLILAGNSGVLYYFDIFNLTLLSAFLMISFMFASSIHVADQWEKAVVLRMGKYTGLKGSGIFFIIPIIDKIDNFIDQRVRVTDFKAEQTLTKDTVPVSVDAVVYWTVWDVEKAALEVQEYEMA